MEIVELLALSRRGGRFAFSEGEARRNAATIINNIMNIISITIAIAVTVTNRHRNRCNHHKQPRAPDCSYCPCTSIGRVGRGLWGQDKLCPIKRKFTVLCILLRVAACCTL